MVDVIVVSAAAGSNGRNDAELKPRALHKTQSIFLRNLAPMITHQEVEAVIMSRRLYDVHVILNFFKYHKTTLFTVCLYTSMVYAVVVCSTIHLSPASVVPKLLHLESHKHLRDSLETTIFVAKDLGEIWMAHLCRGHQM